MKYLIKALRFIFFLVVFASCHKDPPSSLTHDNQGKIGAQGGTVKTSDGASVEIPSGAMNAEKTVSITNETLTNNIVNNGYKVFNLKPDGLTFTDSIVITLPFDDKYIDINNKSENYGVAVFYHKGTYWEELKTEVDLANKIARVKSLHFSEYYIEYPSTWSDYYIKNSNKPGLVLSVPYYLQEGKWGSYYSLSMITKYAGYNYNAAYFAACMNDEFPVRDLDIDELVALDYTLLGLGIQTNISSPPWLSKDNLCGYILGQLDLGLPVWVASEVLAYPIVVTGYDQNGFFLHDPSGDFIKKIEDISTFSLSKYCNYHVNYEQFKSVLSNDPVNPDFGVPAYTLVIKTKGDNPNNGVSINFLGGIGNIGITEYGNRTIGELLFDTHAYSPLGYGFVNPNTGEFITFSNLDSIFVRPIISNSNLASIIKVKLHLKLDGLDVIGSPKSMEIPYSNSHFLPDKMKSSLKDLQKGYHNAEVELRSEDDQILYDQWIFRFFIENYVNVEGTLTDIDNNTYNTVKIGDQIWMAENLQTTKLNNDESIPQAADNLSWAALTTPGYCNGIYGALYNWNSVNTGKLCPTGWHVPSDEEWTTMVNYLGGENVAGLKLKEAGSAHWKDTYAANNESGFTALPGGWRSDDGTFYMGDGTLGRWWTSTPTYTRTMMDFTEGIFRDLMFQNHGLSVRCLKDN